MTAAVNVNSDQPARALTLVGEAPRDSALSTDELGSRIVGLAARLAAATCSWLLLVADFETRDGCAAYGLPSTARWLSHYCGLSHRTAVEHVRVARAVAAFPALAEAMGSGRLSYSQVRAISRIAHPGEDNLVSDLVEMAAHSSAGQLETMVRGLRTVEGQESDDRGEPPEEYASFGWTSESQLRMNARLDPESGAIVQAAIDRVARAEGMTHAQALIRMAVERLLCAGRIRTAVHDDAGNVRDLGARTASCPSACSAPC